ILPLTRDAIAQVHSSKHLTNLQDVIFGLLENSLDARASKVEISVDFHRGDCTVEDNGVGIPPVEFGEDGALGKMYHTFKCAVPVHDELHGTNGVFLASLAALSLLSITSRHKATNEHVALTMYRGKTVGRRIPAPLSHGVSASQGTRVDVRDLFGNMPVRVKQRALSTADNADDERAWNALKQGLAALLLALSRPCWVKIQDSQHASRTVTLAGSHPAASTALTERSLNRMSSRPSKSDVRDLLPILLQAGLAPVETRWKWVAISALAEGVSVKGVINLDPVPTKQCQFISVGVNPCSSESGHNELYDAVNKAFASSSFGTLDDNQEPDEAEKERRKRDRRYKSDGYTQKQLRTKKGVDRWPMFILQIKLRSNERTHSIRKQETAGQLASMIALVEATVNQWLSTHNLKPAEPRKRKNESQDKPAATSSLRALPSSSYKETRRIVGENLTMPVLQRTGTASSVTSLKRPKTLNALEELVLRRRNVLACGPSNHFNSLSRIKSGERAFYTRLWESRKPGTAPAAPIRQKDLPSYSTATLQLHPFTVPVVEAGLLGIGMANRLQVQPESLAEVQQAADPSVEWIDPVTKQHFMVNTRTGAVLPVSVNLGEDMTVNDHGDDTPQSRHRAAIDTSLSGAGRPLSLARRGGDSASETGANWLPSFLKVWDNPVFCHPYEEAIPTAAFNGPGAEAVDANNQRCVDQCHTQYFSEAGTRRTKHLSKAALQQARVIRQVDDKFILCCMPATESGGDRQTVILVDQHAASERVMLEGLLKELCTPIDPSTPAAGCTTSLGCRAGVLSVLLDKPQHFQLSEREAELFTKYAQHFAAWGILYDLSAYTRTATASQVRESAPEHRLSVRALPPGISERCTLFPNLLIELLRSEVWHLAQSSARPRRTASLLTGDGPDRHKKDPHTWLQRIGSCPKGMIDMLNSRACRSAIMFNDVLPVPRCEALLADLSACAFPFMCAHGRVSMVPVVELGG
ncbi:hypothetical protein BAUCODRAFT_40759, partial [Baudoinia panamericana UAMH 10762]